MEICESAPDGATAQAIASTVLSNDNGSKKRSYHMATAASENQNCNVKDEKDQLVEDDSGKLKISVPNTDPLTPGYDYPTKVCLNRIHSELLDCQRDPLDGIFVAPDHNQLNVCHAIIIGPSDTPYEQGIFQFRFEIPNNYPYEPPKVTFLTTRGGTVRFNPNLYACGKVCLSILGTWSGPQWTAAQSIRSVLLSIQSLLQEYPYRNEPGFEDTPVTSPEVIEYNRYIRFETMRVAVIDSIESLVLKHEDPSGDDRLANFAAEHFMEYVEFYKHLCEEYAFLDRRIMKDRFSGRECNCQFRSLAQRIEACEVDVRKWLVRKVQAAGVNAKTN